MPAKKKSSSASKAAKAFRKTIKPPSDEPQVEMVHPNETLRPENERPCPICDYVMRVESKHGVKVDICDDHGIWFDAGEFQQVLGMKSRRSSARRRKAVSAARDEEFKKVAWSRSWVGIFR